MRYEYIEPFVISTVKVLDCILQGGISPGPHTLVSKDELGRDVSVVIDLGGDSEGNIIFIMNEQTALEICGRMNQKQFESLDSLGRDSISELGNMIAGAAASRLNDMGFRFRVFPPAVFIQDEIAHILPNLEILQIPLHTEFGSITMNITLRTN